MNDLEEIKNFGPYMVKIMNLIGIHSREDLMASDYKTIKKNLINVGVKLHLNITTDEKNEIKKILEGVK
jgi:uncharacterized ubiquitin-like protein YukD